MVVQAFQVVPLAANPLPIGFRHNQLSAVLSHKPDRSGHSIGDIVAATGRVVD
jgi:hypothetical protein